MAKEKNTLVKNYIAKALIYLMNKKNFSDISISEITKKAGVSRMAYYRNYFNKEDILNKYMDELVNEYIENRKQCDNSVYSRYLLAFNFFKDNKDFVLAVEKYNLSSIILNKLNEYMMIFYPEHNNNIQDKYNVYIISGAIYNTCKMWITEGLKETPEEITKIFMNKIFK